MGLIIPRVRFGLTLGFQQIFRLTFARNDTA